MAIRKSTASSVNSSSISSFLKGYGATAAELKSAQEDVDYYDKGLIGDDAYISILESRANKSGVTSVQKIQLQNKIDDIKTESARSQIKAAINAGTKTWSDLYDFEASKLDSMAPGSIRYNTQQSKVEEALDKTINTTRARLQQDVQNGNSTPLDVADFENSMTNLFQPGTKAYEEQTYKAQDATRNAQKYEFQQINNAQAARFSNQLLQARDSGDVNAVKSLTEQRISQLQGLAQNYPQFYQGDDLTKLQTEINQLYINSRNFQESYYNNLSAADEKQLSIDVAGKYGEYQDKKKKADININQLTSLIGSKVDSSVLKIMSDAGVVFTGDVITKEDVLRYESKVKNDLLSVLDKVVMGDGKVPGLGSLADSRPDLVGDKLTTLSNDKSSLVNEISQLAGAVKAPGTTMVETGGKNGPEIVDVRTFSRDGRPITGQSYNTKGQYLNAATGEYDKISPDAIYTVDSGGGKAMQYANIGGVLYRREVNAGSETASDFVPASMGDINNMETEAKTVVDYMGIKPEELKANKMQAQDAIAKDVSAALAERGNMMKAGQNYVQSTLVPELQKKYADKLTAQEISEAVAKSQNASKAGELMSTGSIKTPVQNLVPNAPVNTPKPTGLSQGDIKSAVNYTPPTLQPMQTTPMTAQDKARQYMTGIWEGAKPKGGLQSLGDFYTEKTLVPEIQTKFGLNEKEALDLAYETRKPYEAPAILKNMSTAMNPKR